MEPKNPLDRRAARWVRALESGDHEQCRGRLSDGRGLDALGVLAVAVFRTRFREVRGRPGVFADARGSTTMLDYRRLADLDLHEDANEREVGSMRRIVREHEPLAPDERLLKGPYRRGAARYHLVAALSDAGAPFGRIAGFLRSSGWYRALPPAPAQAPAAGRRNLLSGNEGDVARVVSFPGGLGRSLRQRDRRTPSSPPLQNIENSKPQNFRT
ncbi:MAG: hypothetical protein M3Q49_19045 [Actinomycetota bacterium]|nr:hypothetical protein [Actinomycetota bacterium]